MELSVLGSGSFIADTSVVEFGTGVNFILNGQYESCTNKLVVIQPSQQYSNA